MTATDQPAAEPAHARHRRLPAWWPAAAAVVALLIGGLLFVIDNEQESTRADVATEQAVDGATTLDQLCATDPDVAARIPDDCREAREIRRNVVLPASSPGPTQAQVQGWVDRYLADNPPPAGRNATPEQVARAVAEHMEGNGQARITQVAQAYIASNAERFRGEPGRNGTDGEPGRDATDDQVAATVAAFCAERDSCRGPQGDAGPRGEQGRSVLDAQPIRNGDGVCQWVITFQEGDGSRSETRHPAGDAACPAAPPPSPPEEPPGGLLPGG